MIKLHSLFTYLVVALNIFVIPPSNADTEAPSFSSFDVTPREVNVVDSAAEITVSIGLSDNASDIKPFQIAASSTVNNASSGMVEASLAEGTLQNGVWKAVLQIPQGTTGGDWAISVFPISDTANNKTAFGPPAKFDNSLIVNSNATDTEAPNFTLFSISPTEVSVADGAAEVTVTIGLSDNANDIKPFQVSAFSSVNNASSVLVEASLVEGTLQDGIWQAVLEIPKGATSGEWAISVFPISDTADNQTAFGPPAEFDNSLIVNSDATDKDAPRYTSFALDLTEANVVDRAAFITVEIGLSDNLSPIEPFFVVARSKINDASSNLARAALSEGTERNGIWKATLEIPQGTTSGIWEVNVFPISDSADNATPFGPPEEFNAKFFVTGTQKDENGSMVVLLSDYNDDGLQDIGLISNSEDGSTLDVIDSITRTSLLKWEIQHDYSDESIRFIRIPDRTGDGIDEVGLFGIRTNSSYQLFVRDGRTSKRLQVYNWVNNWTNVVVRVLDDLTGDGIAEIALEGIFKAGNRPQLRVEDGASGNNYGVYSYPAIFDRPTYYLHSDFDGDGVNDVVLFGRIKRNGKIQAKLTSGVDSNNKLSAYNFPDSWKNVSWKKLFDMNNDRKIDWGLFGSSRDDGRTMLLVKDATDKRGLVTSYAWPNLENPTLLVISDISGDGTPELAAAGFNSNNNRYQLQIKDGSDRNSTLNNITWPSRWTGVRFHRFNDMDGDNLSEVALQGINTKSGNHELVIVNAVSRANVATLNLGNDWDAPPTIYQLGDTDGDGVPNVLVFGSQNGQAEFCVI